MAAALYALLCLIWGSTWLAIKVGLVGVPPFLGAGLRFLLSMLLVGLVLAARRKRFQLTRDDKGCVLSLGLLVFWLDYAAVYWAETHISSGLTAILFSTMPLMTSLLSAYYYLIKKMDATFVSLSTLIIPIVALALGRAFQHETVTPMVVAGIATILAGVAVAIVPRGKTRGATSRPAPAISSRIP
jgi:drug/metabolite transporter (DMT)-like permease